MAAVFILMGVHANPDGKWWRTLVSMRLDTGYQNFFQPNLVRALNSAGQELYIPNYEHSDGYRKMGKPRTMFLGDFTNDPENWTNKCFAGYYTLKSVKIGE